MRNTESRPAPGIRTYTQPARGRARGPLRGSSSVFGRCSCLTRSAFAAIGNSGRGSSGNGGWWIMSPCAPSQFGVQRANCSGHPTSFNRARSQHAGSRSEARARYSPADRSHRPGSFARIFGVDGPYARQLQLSQSGQRSLAGGARSSAQSDLPVRPRSSVPAGKRG